MFAFRAVRLELSVAGILHTLAKHPTFTHYLMVHAQFNAQPRQVTQET